MKRRHLPAHGTITKQPFLIGSLAYVLPSGSVGASERTRTNVTF